MLRKIAMFCTKAFLAAKNTIVSFIRGTFTHIETIVILTLASFGTTALIGELPFFVALPMWFEQTFIVPVLSVLAVMSLIKLAEWRARRRIIHAA